MEDESGEKGSNIAIRGRRLGRGRGGVSDIIGTILILAITVILFSSIFFFVSSLPGPTAQSTSQFTASLGVSSGKTEAFVNISYTTGPLLPTASTQIYIISSLHQANFICTPTATAGDPYTVGDGLLGAATWSAGQTWSMHLGPASGPSPVTLCPGSTIASLLSTGDQITIKIVNVAQNNLLLFQVTLPGTISTTPPVFVAEGIAPLPVQGTGPFYVWAQIRSNVGVNASGTVWVALTNVPRGISGNGALSAACLNTTHTPQCMVPMTWNSTYGEYCTFGCSPVLNLSATLSGTYPITINVTDKIGQKNSVVINAQFLTSFGALLYLTDSASPGSPYVGQNTTIALTITDDASVGGLITATFTANFGTFCDSQKVCTQVHSFNLTNVNAPPNNYNTVYAYWTAGAVKGGTGQATITMSISGISPQSNAPPIVLTVLPRTLLVDGTGIASGSIVPLDTFTYLTSDFLSAGLADPPDTVTVADSPGTTAASWTVGGATKSCSAAMLQSNATSNLACYDVIVWDAGNYTAGAEECMSSTDAGAILAAITQGYRSVWLMGGDVLSAACFADMSYSAGLISGLEAAFGLSGVGAVTSATSPSALTLTGITLPTAGLAGSNLDLGPAAYYTPLSVNTASAYMRTTSPTSNVATFYTTGTQGNAFASSFDMSTLSEAVPVGGSVVPSTAQQSSMVFDVYDWLANLTTGSVNNRLSPDWGVSQVVVTPSPASFETPTSVNITVRDNGAFAPGTGIVAALTINGLIYTAAGTITLFPTARGGSISGTITWYPSVIGYVTVGACLTIYPQNDTVLGNNCMGTSLFNVQLYVHYSVLVVDDTLSTLINKPDTTPIVVTAMLAARHPLSSITTIKITTACGPAVLPTGQTWASFNIVVWNDGVNTNNSGGTGSCPLSDANAARLASFLSNGGTKASVLFIGAGLLTDVADANVIAFAANYLGVTIPGALATTPTAGILYGVTGDALGNGMTIPYPAGSGNYTFCATTAGSQGATVSPALYYGASDFWTPWNSTLGTNPCGGSVPPLAAADTFGGLSGGWHAAYWGFSIASTGDSPQVSLLMLRTSTFFGRLLPMTDTIVTPPDVTFASVAAPWANFDSIHPQLEQQYLIQANITNLGGAYAADIGISVYDGSHILGSQTLTIGPTTTNVSGITTFETGQLSVSWTPLYGYTNPITVKITSSTAGQVLPGVDNFATWNVTVFFFYDNTNNNVNQWTHNNMALWQDPDDPNCGAPPVAQQIFFTDDNNLAQAWAMDVGQCDTGGNNIGNDAWGMAPQGTCYLDLWYCSALGIYDDENHGDTVKWYYSSTIKLPVSTTSTSANWWQYYSVAPYESGMVVCVINTNNSCVGGPSTAGWSTQVVTPTPGYTGTIRDYVGGACYTVNSFTGVNEGDNGLWNYERLNLSNYRGQWIKVGFGFIEGDNGAHCGGSAVETHYGWLIDQFAVHVTDNHDWPVSEQSITCPSYGSYIPPDLWGLSPSSVVTAAGYTAPPTGGAWVGATVSGTNYVLDPNMWDALISRPIDLSSASNATLTFNYVWNRNAANMDPPLGLVVDVAQATIPGEQNWVQVWTGNTNLGSGLTGWQFSGRIDLSGYAGEVIQVQFLVGTNCGGDTDDAAQFNYPYTGAAMISGVYVAGATSLTAVHPRDLGVTTPVMTMPPVQQPTVAAPVPAPAPAPVNPSNGNSSVLVPINELSQPMTMARWIPPRQ
jgi:hypothetical protein